MSLIVTVTPWQFDLFLHGSVQ